MQSLKSIVSIQLAILDKMTRKGWRKVKEIPLTKEQQAQIVMYDIQNAWRRSELKNEVKKKE
jgi:hypothetical protein